MGEGITAKQAWDRGQLALIATVYAVAAILTTLVGVLYWRAIGVM